MLAAPPQAERIEVGEAVFHMTPLLARPGARLLARLVGLIAAGTGEAKTLDITAVARALGRPDFAEVYLEVCDAFAKSSTVEVEGPDGQTRTPQLSQGSTFDWVFAKRQALLGEAVLAFLKLNFADFFDTLGSVGQSLGATIPKPPTPTA